MPGAHRVLEQLGWMLEIKEGSRWHREPTKGSLMASRTGMMKIQRPGEATENHYLSRFKVCLRRLGYTPRPPLQDGDGRQAWDSDRRVTVNNIQVLLVCGRLGDRGGGTETPAASVPRHKVHARYSEIRNPQWVIFAEENRIVKYTVS